LFTSQSLPGVGASLGLDRLLAAMQELGQVQKGATPAAVLVTYFDAGRLGDYLRIGRSLRREGIAVEVFPDSRALGKQLKYASRQGFAVALIAGEEEFKTGTWQVKDLNRGQQQASAEEALPDAIRTILTDTGAAKSTS
jgi:histidyl-tRNA synthetase